MVGDELVYFLVLSQSRCMSKLDAHLLDSDELING